MIPWEATIGSRIRRIRTLAILPEGITQYSAIFFFFWNTHRLRHCLLLLYCIVIVFFLLSYYLFYNMNHSAYELGLLGQLRVPFIHIPVLGKHESRGFTR